jgi:hypothetical protein
VEQLPETPNFPE